MKPDQPLVSVVVSVAGPTPRLETTIDNLLEQTHTPEVVVTVDAAPDLAAHLTDRYGATVTVDHTPGETGLSAARNRGASAADGDIVAFTDADCTPAEDWVAQLVNCYEDHGAIAAGGPAIPSWPDDRPSRVPHELDWLIGATHRGFEPDGEGILEVRNTFGCNISFQSDVFDILGGFDERLGKRPGREIQGEEAELCARLRDHYGQGVHYNPNATVTHDVDDYQLTRRTLLERSYWQGRSKRVLTDLLPDAASTEEDYLDTLLHSWIPERLTRTVTDRSIRPLVETTWLLVVTAAVATGYLTGGIGTTLETPTETPHREATQ